MTVVVSTVSVTCVVAGIVGGVTVMPLPPLVPVTVTSIWVGSLYTVSFGASGTLTVPVVAPAGMTMTAPLDRVIVRSVSGAWVRVAVYTSTPPASVMVGVALRLRVESRSALVVVSVVRPPVVSCATCPAELMPAVGKPMVGSTRPAVASSMTKL